MGENLGGPGNLNPRASHVTLLLLFIVGIAVTVVFAVTGWRVFGALSAVLATACLVLIGFRMGQESHESQERQNGRRDR